MPKPGYKAITIREPLFKILSDMAEANGKSIPEMLQKIVDEREGGKNEKEKHPYQ